MAMDLPTRHQLLRDRRHWLGAMQGLQADADGTLRLAAVPGCARAIHIDTSLPIPREVSGIVCGPNGAVFVADTAHDRIVWIDGACGSRVNLPPGVAAAAPGAAGSAPGAAGSAPGAAGVTPGAAAAAACATAGSAPGQFRGPRGLALDDQALRVADTGNARLQHMALPLLEAHMAWPSAPAPSAVALFTGPARPGLVVVDGVSFTVSLRRLDPGAQGQPDVAFASALQASGRLQRPHQVAIDSEQTLWVSDSGAEQVFAFDAAGRYLHALAAPAGWMPGALAVHAERVYVADAASASILAFSRGGAFIGALPHWHGPVTAMACDESGDLLVKPGLDAVYHRLTAAAAHVAQGWIEAGPLDAGEGQAWERVWAELATPAGTQGRLCVALQAQALPAPAPGDWTALPAWDALLAVATTAPASQRRMLWLRVGLGSEQPTRSPTLRQARAATAGENYFDHLPATLARHDLPQQEPGGFLSRLLHLVRAQWSGVEELIDELPQRADASFTASGDLRWLASWLALELPRIRNDDERRELIAAAVRLFDRRGTPASMAEFAQWHTGIRPTLIEGFTDRHVWVLGVSGHLDFDSQLPALDPLGWVAAEPAVAAAAVVVGESGPLAAHQIGLPLFAEDAHRFCVFIDAYRLCGADSELGRARLAELQRVIEREKPAHTDFRIELIAPDMRVGLQARVGVDTIVGGIDAGWRGDAVLGLNSRLNPADATHPNTRSTRLGDAVLDGSLTLN